MMIGVAESLIANGGFNGSHMAQTFIRNYEREPWRGYASGPPRVFRWIKSGVPWDEAAKRLFGGAGSYGNGAAMMVARWVFSTLTTLRSCGSWRAPRA